MKTCPSCNHVGDVDRDFGRRRPGGPANSYCRTCAAARTRKWGAENCGRPRPAPNAQKARVRKRRYYERHSATILERQRERDKAQPEKKRERVRRRRARLRAVAAVPVDYVAIRAAHDCCYLCGELLGETVDFDHIIPVVAGGPHVAWNILPTHPRCNRRKAGRLVESLTWVVDSAYCIALATRAAIQVTA
jgi:hypothetical protein